MLVFKGILLFSFILSLFLVYKTHWEIEFHDNNVVLLNTENGRGYSVYNLIQSDLIIK